MADKKSYFDQVSSSSWVILTACVADDNQINCVSCDHNVARRWRMDTDKSNMTVMIFMRETILSKMLIVTVMILMRETILSKMLIVTVMILF